MGHPIPFTCSSSKVFSGQRRECVVGCVVGNDPKTRFCIRMSCHTNPLGSCSNPSLSVERVIKGVPKPPTSSWKSVDNWKSVSGTCTVWLGVSPRCWLKRCWKTHRSQSARANDFAAVSTHSGNHLGGRILVDMLCTTASRFSIRTPHRRNLLPSAPQQVLP